MSIAACPTLPGFVVRPLPHTALRSTSAPARADLGTDAVWLAAYRAGDAGAMEKLFRTYAPYVMAVLRNGCSGARGGHCNVSDPDTRAELMQEVFVRVLSPSMRLRYDAARPFTAFLRGVVRNVMMEHVRRVGLGAQRYVALHTDDQNLLDRWSPIAPLADELLESNDDRMLMREFLGTLTARERRFVTVRFEGGHSQRDAAQSLGLGRQQVRRLDTMMREKLETFMRDRGVETPALAA
jgi:RNA polymerase sigma factor (sigma-70 family)